MGDLKLRHEIQELEDTLKNSKSIPKIEIEIKHHFAKGLYAREAFIPAGVCLTGKIHKFSHVNIISKGKIIVVTEGGKETVTAPHTMVSLPGTKRAGYALEDTVWTTIHAIEEGMTDLDLLEKHLITESYEEIECLGSPLLDS